MGRPGRVRGVPHLESQCLQIALQRGSGHRGTGDDGGRQTNSLLEYDALPRRIIAAGTPPPSRPGGDSAEGIGCRRAYVHHTFMIR
ncbi:hypothetical protein SLNHY_6792 [Streptomyces albus]|nr:hypothetical protein SLNHY_6792 [Streptomyces albus]